MRGELFIKLLFSLLFIMVAGATQVLAETTSTTTMEFSSAIHFLTPAGDDIEVGPGIYEVEAAESWLKLIPEGKGRMEAVLIDATQGTHDETITEPMVRLEGEVESEEENPDVFHLAMLQPDGTGLEAIGTISGIRPRGTQMVFLSRPNLNLSSKVKPPPRVKVVFPNLIYNKPGFVSKRDSDFTDRCVPNVENQITKTLHNGKDQTDILAYRSGGAGAPTEDNKGMDGSSKHRQGIARYHSGTRSYFYITTSVKDDWIKQKKYAGFEIVEWSNHSTSGRLGSNIRNNRRQPPTSRYRVIRFVQEQEQEQEQEQKQKQKQNHPGGIQVMGRFLAVPYFAKPDYIRLYDLKNPGSPVPLGERLFSNHGTQFGFAALTRLNNGHYLAIGGDDKIEVFVTKGTRFFTGWESHSVYKPGKGFVHSTLLNSRKYQGAQFVTDCSGSLYLAFTRKSRSWLGLKENHDWLDVWRVYVKNIQGKYTINITKAFNRHMYCGGSGGSLWCNFMAGVGIYIDQKTGKLLLYGIEHGNDGPKVNGVGSTKMKEFRQR